MSVSRKLISTLNPYLTTKNVEELKAITGNIYETIAVASKRADQINVAVKEELHQKLDDFATHTDTLEEIHENKEQIEISRFYERMANPSLQALNEIENDKIYYRLKDEE